MSEPGSDESIAKQMAIKLEQMYASEGFEIFWKAYLFMVDRLAFNQNQAGKGHTTCDEVAMDLRYKQGQLDGLLSLSAWKDGIVEKLRAGEIPWRQKEGE